MGVTSGATDINININMNNENVVVLAGGTGGAKLARGMADVVEPERVAAIVNTGDDIEIYGAYVSPDPDLVSFWLADQIDERGWGLQGDTFAVMDALRELGADVWFNLGDRDLAWCLERARMLAEGLSPTAALAHLNATIGVRARVLPMSDDPVRTWVRTGAGWFSFQQFMIRERAAGPRGGARVPRRRAGDRRRAGAGGDRERPRDRDRPVEPARLDRPDPRRARDPRGADRRRRPRRRRQPDRRRRGAQGPDGLVHGVRRARVQRATASPTSTASCSTG